MQPSLFPEDTAHLPGLASEGRHPEGAVYEAHAILDRAIRSYRPARVYALFSGGHDSLCASHVASTHLPFHGCVHINTGIGVADTRQFVRATCARQGWPLLEYHPPPYFPGRCRACRRLRRRAPRREDCPACLAKMNPAVDYAHLPAYDAITLHHGFCGPGGHTLMYNRLKERCLRQLRRDVFGRRRGRGQVILLVGGMRSAESARRMGHAEEVSEELNDGRVWCAPIIHWTDTDKDYYLHANQLPRNPVTERLCMSGECLCGSFARPQEMVELERHYPEAARRIHDLEERARTLGVHATWGTRHPNSQPERARKRRQADDAEFFGLCWSCVNKYPAAAGENHHAGH